MSTILRLGFYRILVLVYTTRTYRSNDKPAGTGTQNHTGSFHEMCAYLNDVEVTH